MTALVLQNCTLALVMRYSRSLPGDSYIPSTAVFLAEIIKLFMSVALSRWTCDRFTFRQIIHGAFGSRKCLKLAIPAALYAFQNWLQYIAISRMEATVFQVTAQLKILTTAVCFVCLLHKSLSCAQWISLGILTIGVTLIQLPERRAAFNATNTDYVGFFALLVACCMSGLAGVYFEKLLKEEKANVWIRNTQLAAFSILFSGIVGVAMMDREEVWRRGFWVGYSIPACGTVLLNSLGGIIVALVVVSADNVAKGFASSISIVLSCIVSAAFFDLRIRPTFILGTGLVMTSTYLYSSYTPRARPVRLPLAKDSIRP